MVLRAGEEGLPGELILNTLKVPTVVGNIIYSHGRSTVGNSVQVTGQTSHKTCAQDLQTRGSTPNRPGPPSPTQTIKTSASCRDT